MVRKARSCHFPTPLYAALLLLAGGCASTPKQEPTHYRDAKAKSQSRCQEDNAACEARNGAGSANPMLAKGGAFQAYRDGMISRGVCAADLLSDGPGLRSCRRTATGGRRARGESPGVQPR